jgi:hypothetical protein
LAGVGHPLSIATSFNGRAFGRWRLRWPFFQSRAVAVGHPLTSETVLRLLSVFPAGL